MALKSVDNPKRSPFEGRSPPPPVRGRKWWRRHLGRGIRRRPRLYPFPGSRKPETTAPPDQFRVREYPWRRRSAEADSGNRAGARAAVDLLVGNCQPEWSRLRRDGMAGGASAR